MDNINIKALEELENRDYNIESLYNKIVIQLPPDKQGIVKELERRNYDKYTILKIMLNPPKAVQPKQQEVQPSFWERFKSTAKEEAPAALGATIGALRGSSAGIPGAVTGAFIGGTLGELGKVGGEIAFGEKESPATIGDLTKIGLSAGLEGTKQAGYELAGGLLAKGTAKVLLPFVKKAPFSPAVTEEAQTAYNMLEKYMPQEDKWFPRFYQTFKKAKKPSLLPAEATDNWVMDFLHNVTSGAILGGKHIKDFQLLREKAIDNMMDDLIKSFGGIADADDLGRLFILTANNNLKINRLPAKVMYNTIESKVMPVMEKVKIPITTDTGLIDELGRPLFKTTYTTKLVPQKGVKISLKSLKKFAKPIFERSKAIDSLEAKNMGDDLVETIVQLPNEVDYKTAQSLYTRLRTRVEDLSITNKNAPGIGIANQLKHRLRTEMGQKLKNYDKDAFILWKSANKLWRETSKKYNNRFIRQLIKAGDEQFGNEPEKIVSRIFIKGGISRIKSVKEAVGTQVWDKLKNYLINDIIRKSTKDNIVHGSTMLEKMFGKSGYGKQVMEATFNPLEIKMIKDTATTLKVIQAKQGQGIGHMWIQLAQAGAATTMVFTGMKGTAPVILLGPAILARLFTNPTANKWFLRAVRLGIKAPQEAALAMRMMEMAYNIVSNKPLEIKPIQSISTTKGYKYYQDIFNNKQQQMKGGNQ
jgi:hypothetical protein